MVFQRLVACLICSQIALVQFAFAANLNLAPNERPPIRNKILSCLTMFTPKNQVDDSVGIPFSNNSPDVFEAEIRNGVASHGLEHFRGGTFFVLGTPMKNKRVTRAEYQNILDRNGLTSVGAKVSVLAAPSALLGEEGVNLARQIFERMLYLLPSTERDLQRPRLNEVLNNWVATLAVEVGPSILLFKSMPPAQAALVIGVQGVILATYNIYAKSMTNYLLRNASRSDVVNGIDVFGKQALFSLPFLANFNGLGHLSELTAYYAANGWDATLAQFPQQIATLGTTQGLTLFLQTTFYAFPITRGFGAWVDGQVGEQNVKDARDIRPILQIPFLATDAMFLILASGYSQPLFEIGPMQVNSGHAGLIALTTATWLFFKKYPKAFDVILRRYQAVKARRAAARGAATKDSDSPTKIDLDHAG